VDDAKEGSGGNAFKMPPLAADALAQAGFDIVALANNHAMDMGMEGLLDTLDHLDRAGVAHVGAGRNVAEARKAAFKSQACRHASLRRPIPQTWRQW
jgi:poly-gamma-glutamate synthesis protein (capsule biosynthesis protein)